MRAQILIFAFAGVVLASLAALSATKKDGQAILDNWTIFLRGNPYDEAASEPEQIANRVEHSTSTPVKKPSTNDASVKSVRVPLLNDSVCRVPLLDDTVYRVPLLDDTAQRVPLLNEEAPTSISRVPLLNDSPASPHRVPLLTDNTPVYTSRVPLL